MKDSLSVIVPVYNAASTLRSCLEAILHQSPQPLEVIVVNDHSTDESPAIASSLGVQVIDNHGRRGPGAARNLGVEHTKGDLVFFVDSDVLLPPNTISRVLQLFSEHPEIAALFGSYDEDPQQSNFLSQYKNLMHHYVHQISSEQACTFWAGCGAVRREAFKECAGFDEERFPNASIEDIDLGFRMRKKGYPILLDKKLQAKHLKRWKAGNLLKADIYYRAYPWSKLILESGEMPVDLNLRISDRLSGGLVSLMVLTTLLLPVAFFLLSPGLAGDLAIFDFLLLAALLYLNRSVYLFFLKRRGLLFTLGVIPWHFFYYFYSTLTFLFCWLELKIFRRGKARSLRLAKT